MEVLFEIFGELLIQLLFEALAQAGIHAFRNPDRLPAAQNPWLVGCGYALLGAICGAATLIFLPHYLLHSGGTRWVYLLLAPVAAGAGSTVIGILRTRDKAQRLGLDRFAYGYVFALAFALVRFNFAS